MSTLRARILDTESLAKRLDPVLESCSQALEALSDRGRDGAENVHLLRKNGKKLRGGLEILGAPKPVIVELRDMGRLLGSVRDAAVRLQTLHALCAEVGEAASEDVDFPVALGQLELEARICGPPPEAVRRFTEERLRAVSEWIARPSYGGSGGVARRMRRLVRRARSRLARIAGNPKRLEAYHESRKAVKAALGAAQFLFQDPEGELRRELRRLDRLGENLGWIQDLDVLDQWLDRHGLSAERLPALHSSLRGEIRRACATVRRRAKKCRLGVIDGDV